jgi:RimJ/RimL family protein N-acetyltransferase
MIRSATDRLLLRPFRPTDLPALAAIHRDGDTMRHFGSGVATGDAEAARRAGEQIALYNEHWAEHGFGIWALEDRTDGAFLGRVGLRWIAELDAVELLYLIIRPRWGEGFAAEAGAAALAFGFQRIGLGEIIALAMPANRASLRVMEKLGMGYRCRQRVWQTDLIRCAIDRADFLAANPPAAI